MSEIETWVQEKLPLVSNEDYGRDETSAKTLLRKHETLQLEFEIFDKRIVELDLQFKHMVEQGNCDSDAIQKRQVMLTYQLNNVALLTQKYKSGYQQNCWGNVGRGVAPSPTSMIAANERGPFRRLRSTTLFYCDFIWQLWCNYVTNQL